MREKIETRKAPAAIGPYAQGVMVEGFLFASGQLPVNPETGLLAGTTIEEQAEQSMKNVGAVLEILLQVGLLLGGYFLSTFLMKHKLNLP